MAKKVTKSQAKKAAKAAKKHPVAAIIIVALLLTVVIAAVILYFAKPDLYHKYLGVGEHTYTEWVRTEPTCQADGSLSRHCTVCGEEEVEVIPKNYDGVKHVYTEWTTTEATCGEDGYRVRHCTECGEEDSEILPATGEHNMGPDNVCTVCGYNANVPAVSDVEIHFLELGNGRAGDCILIDCGDTELLIDAGSQKNSAETIKKYIDKYCTDGVLEYVVSTHSDEDHISALIGSKSGSGRTGIAYQYSIGTYIKFDKAGSDGNGKPLVTAGGSATLYGEYLDTVKYLEDNGTNVYTASQCYEEKDGAKRQYYLDDAHSVSFNILYNYYYYNASSDENNYSVVTLLTQELADGSKHYLFTGDLEESGESKMVDYYANKSNSKSAYDILPEVELFKAGHHGSKTSSTEKLLKVIKPKNVVVCCCCGQPEYTKTNANTFPTQDMLDRVGQYTDKIYVTTLATDFPPKDENGNYTALKKTGNTSMNGDIVFYTEKGKLKLRCSNNTTVLKDTEWFKENRTWNGV